MPPRIVVLLIVAGWLATMSWLLYREWWQWHAAEGAPPFLIDLVDEAAPQAAAWHVLRDDKEIATARTSMEPQKDDSFALSTEINNLELDFDSPLPLGPFGKVKVRLGKLRNVVRVNRDGELLRLHTDVEIELAVQRLGFHARFEIRGVPRDGRLELRAVAELPTGNVEHDLPSVEFPSRNVLNPLLPLNRIKALTPGRRWRITQVDPIADALAASIRQMATQLAQEAKGAGELLQHLPVGGPRELLAEVLPEKQPLTWKGQVQDCWVIEYRSKEVAARTWVRASDGLVLRQETIGMGERLTLQRFE
jgi:hypothetical protein